MDPTNSICGGMPTTCILSGIWLASILIVLGKSFGTSSLIKFGMFDASIDITLGKLYEITLISLGISSDLILISLGI